MRKIVFATNNKHKLEEIRDLLKNKFEVVSLKEIGFNEDIPETGKTLKENASIKSNYIHDRYNINCFADDTGLEVDALNGEPGVYSARYAGEGCSYDDNVNKLLENIKGVSNRKARFKTVISLIYDDKEYFFEGQVEGIITEEKHGKGGFGYDPIFLPDGYDKTFAEMPLELKNKISHRALATEKLVEFLNTISSC